MANVLTMQERCYIASYMNVYHSTAEVRRRFQAHFGRRPPTHRTVRRIYENFVNTGSVLNKKRNRMRVSTDEHTMLRVQAYFDQNQRSSIRIASRELQLTYYAVQRSLKMLTLKPFRISSVHGLLESDLPKRFQSCCILAEMVRIQPDILDNIIFSDEATFHVSGVVNSSTCRIWAYENPHASVQFYRDSPKVNVWCGMTSQTVIGPFFFVEESVQQTNYLDMLENYAVPIMNEIGLTQAGYFMQDGAPPHWSVLVRDYLDNIFPSRWIGRDGPITWPARSPDLTPCDFFVWGFVKNDVYRSPIANIRELREKVAMAFTKIGPQLLQSVSQETVRRWHVCIERQGRQVESSTIL